MSLMGFGSCRNRGLAEILLEMFFRSGELLLGMALACEFVNAPLNNLKTALNGLQNER